MAVAGFQKEVTGEETLLPTTTTYTTTTTITVPPPKIRTASNDLSGRQSVELSRIYWEEKQCGRELPISGIFCVEVEEEEEEEEEDEEEEEEEEEECERIPH